MAKHKQSITIEGLEVTADGYKLAGVTKGEIEITDAPVQVIRIRAKNGRWRTLTLADAYVSATPDP